MKYIKLYENFNLDSMVNRINHALNLIGINMKSVVSADIRTFAVRNVQTGDVVKIFNEFDMATRYINKAPEMFRIEELNKQSSNIRYEFDCNLVSIPNNLVYNCICSKYKSEGIELSRNVYIVDSNEFRIDTLEYYSSKDKEILEDGTIISFRTRKNDSSTISTLFKYVIEHFANCSDMIIDNKGRETSIEGIGKFIEQYLRLNRHCMDITINKKMAKFYLKNSLGDYNSYGDLQKKYPLVYQTLSSLNAEVNKSSEMSGMGFGD